MVTIRWFDLDDDKALGAPQEWGHAWGALEAVEAPLGAIHVSSGGERLPVSRRQVGGAERVGFRWPRRDPGHHAVQIEIAGTRSTVPVRVAPRKLDDDARAAMLEQLALGLPMEIAWALDPSGAWAGATSSHHDRVTIAGEVERLKRAIFGDSGGPTMGAVVQRIASDPRVEFVAEHRWTRVERVRLPATSHLAEAWQRAGNLDAQGAPRTLVERAPRSTHDTYENRVTFAWVARVDAALRWLAPHCDPGALDPLQREVRIAMRALSVLEPVVPLAGAPTRVTMPILRRPDYRAAFDGLVALTRRTVARLDDVMLRAPLDNLPMLYQRWGTLRVVAAVLRGAAREGWRVRRQRLVTSVVGDTILRLVPDGQPLLIVERPDDGATLSVIAERTYSDHGALRSLTYRQRPDVALERTVPMGGRAVWLFDPKYKLVADEHGETRPPKADVDKMHAYRDAIRGEDGRHVVRLAALLYLGDTVWWGEEIAALRAHPHAVEALDRELDSALAPAFRTR